MNIASLASSLLEALTAHLRQADRLLRLSTVDASGSGLLPGALAGQGFVPETVSIDEQLSKGGSRIQLTAVSLDAHADLDALMGTPVLLELLTAASREALRPFHGHITKTERLGSNGGLARYAFTIEPWTSFLAHRRDSHLWVEKTVIEIIEDLISDYAGQGQLVPLYRWELADAARYSKRSLTVQYEESDLNFLERLLAEEGIAYHFEHSGDAASPSLGSHTLVLADHNDAYPVSAQPVARYHRAHATEASDTIQAFSPQAVWKPGAINLASWDYKSLGSRPVTALADTRGKGNAIQRAATLTLNQQKSHYGYADSVMGERLARQQMEALQTEAQRIKGQGVLRAMAPGSWFSLIGHPRYGIEGITPDGNNRFIAMAVQHRAKNNFKADLGKGIQNLLGALKGGQSAEPDAPLYENHFSVLPASTILRLPARPELKPQLSGAQTALVVGPSGTVVHTDRDHRICVQFHWQRGASSHSRLPHPAGHDNAPADASQSVWLRVKADQAGANWGQVALPRVGQEVLIHCLDGDPDRPLVTGALYNGQGQTDAQGNRIQSGGGNATGNAAAWFAGTSGAHAHPAVLSGIQSQSLDSSQTGGGGHNALLFDATPQQARISASSTQHSSSLTLGHLKQQKGNERKADRGHGFELNTQASGLIKGGQGLLLTTEAASAQQGQLQGSQLTATLEHAQALTEALAVTADKHLPKAAKKQPAAGVKAQPSGNASSQAQAELITSLGQTAQGQPSAVAGGGEGQATAWSAPHLIAHGQAGLVALTPANLYQTAGQTFSQIAGADLNRLSQGSQTLTAKDGLTLFTHGQIAKDADGNAVPRVVKDTGLKLHAASGPVSVQAQSDALNLNAQKAVNIASTHGEVSASAKGKLMLTAKGAAITIEGGNITLMAPGAIKLHAAKKVLTGPASAEAEQLVFKRSELKIKKRRRLGFSG